MLNDATRRPSGGSPPEVPRPAAQPDREVRAVAESLASDPEGAASQFVGRVSQLDIGAIRTAVQAWRQAMRAESDTWFAAEQAAGRAVLAAGRTAEQEVLLDRIAECVLRGVWYRGGARGESPRTPEERVGATEASAQYVSTVAMLALLVRDRLPAAQFAVLYRPFATLISVADLRGE